MPVAIYTLTSALHDEASVVQQTREFLDSLQTPYVLKGADYSEFGTSSLNLIYVRTGGTECLFREMLSELAAKATHPFYLLASAQANSLPASMEILCFLQQKKLDGRILHGTPEYLKDTIRLLEGVEECRRKLRGSVLGIIGRPSDWLISCAVDPGLAEKKLGVRLVQLGIEEVEEELEAIESKVPPALLQSEVDPLKIQIAPICDADRCGVEQSLPGALKIYHALKQIVTHHKLSGFTLRCFDLLSSVHNTGCTALAKLNAEGIVAGCEGDVPALLSLFIAQTLTGQSGFQANPSSINPTTGDILFAHCTISLSLVSSFTLDTHFESGIGVAIHGVIPAGPVTVFRLSPSLSSSFISEGDLVQCTAEPGICRTQLKVRLTPKDALSLLTHPLGNHHIIMLGHWGKELNALMESIMK